MVIFDENEGVVELARDQAETVCEVKLCLLSQHPGFDGHFPGIPVFPGVHQLALVVRVIECCFLDQVAFEVKGMDAVKFANIIAPDTTLTVRVEKCVEHFAFRLFDGDTVFSSGKLRR